MSKIKQIIALLLVLITPGIFSLPVAAQSKKTPAAFDDPALVKKYQQMIAPETLASRLYFLASDLFEGRETGTRGQKLAAQYLASQYRLMGLEPKGTVKNVDRQSPSAYFQPFNLYRLMPKEFRLEVTANGAKTVESVFSSERSDDLSYYQSGTPGNANGGVVFAGYGIADDKLGFNDYTALSANNISIDGKWLLVLADEPLADEKTSLLPTADHKISAWTTGYIEKSFQWWKAGHPKGILMVSDLSPLDKTPFKDRAADASLHAKALGRLSPYANYDIPPVYAVSAKFANQILASSGRKIEDLKQQIDKDLKPNVFEVKDVAINSTVERSKEVETENILAFIEGSDPKLKDEVVVITAHYDHLGNNPLLQGDSIFNGAADDGSGTVAALEMAQMFMKAKQDGFGPRRSILFFNSSGEEKGILGSFYYLNNEPVIPLDKTVADINMDGVGGIDLKHPTGSKNYIYIGGQKGLSDELLEINKRIKAASGSDLELTETDFNSDSRNFGARLIPYIYYSTGLTEHYHRPSDEANTIDYDHMTRVVQLIFATAWQVANQDTRIASVDRSKLKLAGYACGPCNLACDKETFDHPGSCPMCGMPLAPKYVMQK